MRISMKKGGVCQMSLRRCEHTRAHRPHQLWGGERQQGSGDCMPQLLSYAPLDGTAQPLASGATSASASLPTSVSCPRTSSRLPSKRLSPAVSPTSSWPTKSSHSPADGSAPRLQEAQLQRFESFLHEMLGRPLETAWNSCAPVAAGLHQCLRGGALTGWAASALGEDYRSFFCSEVICLGPELSPGSLAPHLLLTLLRPIHPGRS